VTKDILLLRFYEVSVPPASGSRFNEYISLKKHRNEYAAKIVSQGNERELREKNVDAFSHFGLTVFNFCDFDQSNYNRNILYNTNWDSDKSINQQQ